MLTRRSRKEGVASPSDTEKPSKAKRSATPSKAKKPVAIRRRSKSKSVERKIRTRSRSVTKTTSPRVVLERYDPKKENPIDKKKEIKNDKAVQPVNSKTRKSPTPVKEVNSKINPTMHNTNDNISIASSRSRLDYNEESDDEPKIAYKTKTYPTEFGGSVGNILLTAFFPMSVILVKIAIKTKGNLIPFPRGYLRLANYYDQEVFIWTAAIIFLQLLISLVPLAKKSRSLLNDDFKFIHYRFSGFFNLIIAALIIWLMDYYKCPINFILEMVTKKTVPHIVASVLYTSIFSIILFIKAKYIDKINDNSSFNFIQKLFTGTIINPTLGPINIKLAFCRYSSLMTILFNYLVIMDSLKNPVNIHLYFVAGLQIFFALDKLIFEFNLLSSFYLQNEKDGYWTIIQQFLQPIINFLPIQILLANNLPVNYYVLSISSFIFLFGYICQRYSDFTKYQYEKNLTFVYKPTYVRTIVDGIWSYVRYPNYIGTIIVHLALILPIFEPNLGSLQSSWPVLFYPLYYIITLSHQCVRISTFSRLQYGDTWDRYYTTKWNLIPKIF
ncbi:PREDICTED: lamin-B receptor [Diuraphis noxia]|uniref:lamin-B receptor n=1 Tax=Diuraphis noxia TaxID=143948 RepID=UPI000763991C|nr:PREDICTED: lamin-B receptor [Diuraphis noxia]